jgi:non-ribosomal peptide synthetase component F
VERRGVLNMAADARRVFDVRPGDTLFQFTNFAYDNSVLELYTALLNGASVFSDDSRAAFTATADTLEETSVCVVIFVFLIKSSKNKNK